MGKSAIQVSVPSRGILFPNIPHTMVGVSAKNRESFRPLSGHLISKLANFQQMKLWKLLFPSPLGASYFQILFCSFNVHRRIDRFPSPLGASYFQIFSWRSIESNYKGFPSPLGASYFQIFNEKYVGWRFQRKLFPSPLGASYFQIIIEFERRKDG